MSTNAYMEPTSYPSHYGGVPDRSAQLFQADAHEPRAPRPFDAHPGSDPYVAPNRAPHPGAGPLDEPHSPLSSYRGSFSHPSGMGLPHHRQDSISSISSPYDVNGGWTPGSPGLAPSRHASIYSLNGQFDSVGLAGSSLDGSSSSGHIYEQSPPLPPQVRYAQAQAADSRRFSLDERSIRAQPMGKPSMISAEYQAPGQGRHWPWGNNNAGNIHGRHASVSAAPPQGYDYSRMPYGAPPSGLSNSSYGYDANAMSAMSPTRYRSMSSSAASGRSYGAPYGPPGSAAHAAAAIGYGMVPHMGVMMEGEIPSGPGPARRAKFKRSRTGCLVCRKRKVKCSQDGTPCKQCRIGKRDCHYDDSPQKKKGKKGGDKATSGSKKGDKLGSDPLSAQLPPQDGYYAPTGGVDHRGSVDASLAGNGAPHTSGGVTFSMPFSSPPAPAVSATHGPGSTEGTWSNSSPFAPGPHGEPHPGSHAGDYGWAPKDDAHANGYADSGDRRESYWNQQHPAAYGQRGADLEHTEA